MSQFKLKLASIGPRKINVIKAVREVTGLGILDSKNLVEQLGVVAEGVEQSEAIRIKRKMEAAGAQVELLPTERDAADLQKALSGFVEDQAEDQADRRKVAGAAVIVRTAGGVEIASATTNDQGQFSIPEFARRAERAAEAEQPALEFEVRINDQPQKIIRNGFSWDSFLMAEEFLFSLLIASASMSEPESDEDELFLVRGVVRDLSGDPMPGLRVRAYDRDLRRRQPLGEPHPDAPHEKGVHTNEAGAYEIRYSRDQFRRVEKDRADLELRLFNDLGREIETTASGQVHFNAEPEVRIDLQLTPAGNRQTIISEYELERAMLEPLLDGVSLAALTEADIDFLQGDTQIEHDHIRFIARDARLSGETGLPDGVFYGLARRGLVEAAQEVQANLVAMLALPLDDIFDRGLEPAIEAVEIPDAFRDRLNDIAERLRQLQAEQERQARAAWPRHTVAVKLVTAEGQPALGYEIQGADVDTGEPVEHTLSDQTPEEQVLRLRVPPESSSTRDLRLNVVDFQGNVLHEAAVTVDLEAPEAIDLAVTIPEPTPPALPGQRFRLAAVPETFEVDLPGGLLETLADRGAHTLADVRRLEADDRLSELRETFGQESVDLLRAQADLSLISDDPAVISSMIRHNYTDTMQVAETSIDKWLENINQEMETKEALGLWYAAQATVATFDSLATGFARDIAERLDVPKEIAERLKPYLDNQKCRCDCNHALSPAAYLAELLDYITTYLDVADDEELDLVYLREHFHQPFDKLPASCDHVKEQILQVRICVEVLRSYTGLASLGEEEQEYLVATYEQLLEKLGTTLEELESAQGDEEEDKKARDALAARLGIDPSRVLPGELLIDENDLTEDSLAALFGWAVTTELLASPPARPDFLRWQYDQIGEATTEARREQRQAAKSALNTAVREVEEQTLPMLRDALIEAGDAPGSTLETKAEWITEQLQIDARTSGCQMTTRIAQAIETLQSLVFSIRTGQLDPDVGAFEPLPQRVDEDWKWLGSYKTWKSATAMYLYPENVLLPTLRQRQTPGFKKLSEELSYAQEFSLKGVRASARRYFTYFQDICGLKLQAGGWSVTPANGLGDLPGNSHVLFVFAYAPLTNRLYWSVWNPAANDTDYSQTDWTEIPESRDSGVLLGAAPYDAPGEDSYICLFFSDYDPLELRYKLSVRRVRLGPEALEWEQPQSLEMPPDVTHGHYSVLVVNAETRQYPPQIVLNDVGTGDLYYRTLNRTATNWSDDMPWQLIYSNREIAVDINVELQRWVTSKSEPERARGIAGVLGFKQGTLDVRTEVPVTFTKVKIPQYLTAVQNPSSLPDAFLPKPLAAFTTGTAQVSVITLLLRDGDKLVVADFAPGTEAQLEIRVTKDMLEVGELSDAERDWFEGTDDLAIKLVLTSEYHSHIRHTVDIDPSAQFVGATPEFVWWRHQSDSSGTSVLRRTLAGDSTTDAPTKLDRVLQGPGADQDGPLLYQLKMGRSFGLFVGTDEEDTFTREAVLKPLHGAHFSTASRIPEEPDLKARKVELWLAYALNIVNHVPRRILDYFNEAYYAAPIYIALKLQQHGLFMSALDWYRLIYDYAAADADARQIFAHKRLELNVSETDSHERAEDWFRDPVNPHLYGRTRKDTYLRFTLLSIIDCLLSYADQEFTRDTAESLSRARTLYITALELLDHDVLGRSEETCQRLVLDILNGLADESLRERVRPMMLRLADEGTPEHIHAARRLLQDDQDNEEEKVRQLGALVERVEEATEAIDTFETLHTKRKETRRKAFRALSASSLLAGTSAGVNDFVDVYADGQVTEISPEDTLHLSPLLPEPYIPKAHHSFCIPPNPYLEALYQDVSLKLQLLRDCRNIAGIERTVPAYAVTPDAESGLPRIGASGQLVLPDPSELPPTRYRYPVLVELAKQFTNIAQQVETAYLSALQSHDAERYSQLKASQDLQLTRAGVRLQDLRVSQAEDEVTLAELQEERAQIQMRHYQDLVSEDLTELESRALNLMRESTVLSAYASATYFAAGIAGSVNPIDIFRNPSDVISTFGQGASQAASTLSTQASILSTRASYERRQQQWRFQRRLAKHDVRIGTQQIRIAEGSLQIAGQERNIAQMRTDHAETTADFLANKHLNAELYDWMGRVLGRVYAYFLQQATALAKMAEAHLAFERQEPPLGHIQDDYWSPTDEVATTSDVEESIEKLGLTGSARLLQDLYRLDQYAFETDKRKQQVTKTISLVRQDPFAFEQFRQTGILRFNTTMTMFDHDFPGHYLRLIKRVRTSVIALIPPTEGIKATLASVPPSRVITKGEANLFQSQLIPRNPETLSLSSPFNSSGKFEMQPESQPQMYNFFEGNGVEMGWEFRLPKASNQFDFSTIADVLFTIDYTALYDTNYQRQVIEELDTKTGGDRTFSFRQELADQWYDLNNPELIEETKQMTVRFETRREDFPPNIEGLTILNVLLYFVRADDMSFEVDVEHLLFREPGQTDAERSGGSGRTNEGIISTRRGNAGSWLSMIGKRPVGEWELKLPNTTELWAKFKNEEIEDILFVITYEGETPAWPA